MSREEKLQADLRSIQAFFDGLTSGLFCDYAYDSLTLSFVFAVPEQERLSCSFIFTEDYPEGTTRCVGNHQPESVSGRLPAAFYNLAEELCTQHGLLVPPMANLEGHLSSPQSVDRIDSQMSWASGGSDIADDDYYDDDLMGDDDDGNTLHPLLEADIKRLKENFGDDALTLRIFGEGFEYIDVEIRLDMTKFLEEPTADAWHVSLSKPLIVRLHICRQHYLNYVAPQVEVYQVDEKKTCGVLAQIRKIVEVFVSERWKALSNEEVERHVASVQRQQSIGAQQTSARSTVAESTDGLSPSVAVRSQGLVMRGVTAVKRLIHGSDDFDQGVAKLVEMGYTAERARNALQICNNVLDDAAHLLMTSPESCDDPGKDEIENDQAAPAGSDVLTAVPSCKLAKALPSLDRGFLCQLMAYLHNRISTLNEYCVVCDELHVFQNAAMLKPTVCARELCIFAFQTLGVMSDAAEEIATGPEVVDLLVNMCNAAACSGRRDDIFDPYPTVIHPTKPTELALTPTRKDFGRVLKAMAGLLNMDVVMSLKSSVELKETLGKKDILSYPLLQWIVSSNRSHIVKLPKPRCLKFIKTNYQYLLISDSPAKESAFRHAKKQYGSTFAFHGSNIENWHSIMRNGLMIASGTKYQLHGAAYGRGIYLSPEIMTSMGYTNYGNFPKRSGSLKASERFLTKNIICLALCEVITSPELKKNGAIWVCANAQHVCTRFFFVFEQGSLHQDSVSVDSSARKAEILECIKGSR